MNILLSAPVLSIAETKAWEASLLKDEAAAWAAMQRAGAALAHAVAEDFREIGGLPANARLLVLAGKGNNGGDALLAAAEILRRYPQAQADVVMCFAETLLRPLAKRALDELCGTGLLTRVRPVTAGQETQAAKYDLCLDGIFGFQFRPPMDAATAEILARVNAHPDIRLRAAVDLPSGLGETNGGTVFRADFTYATGIVKAPVLAEANAAFVGRVRYLDLGFFKVERVDPNAPEAGQGVAGDRSGSPDGSTSLATPSRSKNPASGPVEPSSPDRILLPQILRPLGQLRPARSDKRTYGHLFVLGGSRNYPGAVLMTVRAALRSGVGLLTAFVPESLVPEYAARFPEAMWVGLPQTLQGGISGAGVPLLLEKLPRASALVIGPGLGAEPETLAAVREIVRNRNISQGADDPKVPNKNIPLLLDADALRPEIVAEAAGQRIVCTPHAGEYARIAGVLRPAENTVLVRKGSPTHVSAGGANYYSLFGGPVLARGGSGDLLAGLIGGLLAQKPDNLLLAAARGVVWHGFAADLLARDQGQVAVQTTQLLDYLQPALHEAQ